VCSSKKGIRKTLKAIVYDFGCKPDAYRAIVGQSSINYNRFVLLEINGVKYLIGDSVFQFTRIQGKSKKTMGYSEISTSAAVIASRVSHHFDKPFWDKTREKLLFDLKEQLLVAAYNLKINVDFDVELENAFDLVVSSDNCIEWINKTKLSFLNNVILSDNRIKYYKIEIENLDNVDNKVPHFYRYTLKELKNKISSRDAQRIKERRKIASLDSLLNSFYWWCSIESSKHINLFYIAHFYDFRGRVYPCNNYSPTGNKYLRHMYYIKKKRCLNTESVYFIRFMNCVAMLPKEEINAIECLFRVTSVIRFKAFMYGHRRHSQKNQYIQYTVLLELGMINKTSLLSDGCIEFRTIINSGYKTLSDYVESGIINPKLKGDDYLKTIRLIHEYEYFIERGR
jgi:hypothetical protein